MSQRHTGQRSVGNLDSAPCLRNDTQQSVHKRWLCTWALSASLPLCGGTNVCFLSERHTTHACERASIRRRPVLAQGTIGAGGSHGSHCVSKSQMSCTCKSSSTTKGSSSSDPSSSSSLTGSVPLTRGGACAAILDCTETRSTASRPARAVPHSSCSESDSTSSTGSCTTGVLDGSGNLPVLRCFAPTPPEPGRSHQCLPSRVPTALPTWLLPAAITERDMTSQGWTS